MCSDQISNVSVAVGGKDMYPFYLEITRTDPGVKYMLELIELRELR